MKSTNIIIAIIVLVLIGGGAYLLNKNKSTESMMKDEMMMKEEAMMQNDEMMSTSTPDSNPSVTQEDTMITDNVVAVKGGMYEVYSPEKLANAEAGDVVLFFKANWCPSCRTVDADIKSNLSSIPQNLTILELDYDKTSDLKKKYGITTQHTFVQVGKDGNMIKKWSGGSTLNSIVQEII
jgi:thiol-disulfide isomerase/thioredoxin